MSNEKNTMDRASLLKTAGLVKAALATADYIPALTHIAFDGGYATAYNDISAIAVRCKASVERCLPGDLLIRALNSFGADQVHFQQDKDGGLIVSSGRGRIKLPTLELKAHPYQQPEPDEGKGDTVLAIEADILKGIERCLMSVNTDPTHPAQMGVTLDADDSGMAVLFSTDNFTISRYQTKTKVALPGDAPVILPRFFCEQLIALARAFPGEKISLWLLAGALFATFGKDAELFSKTPAELEPLDFPAIFNKHAKLTGLKKLLFPIPNAWDAAFQRAMLVLGNEDDKATEVTLDDGVIKLKSTSKAGDADDQMSYEAGDGDPDKAFHVDPTHVARATKQCTQLGFTANVLILADSEARFVHLIAHCKK